MRKRKKGIQSADVKKVHQRVRGGGPPRFRRASGGVSPLSLQGVWGRRPPVLQGVLGAQPPAFALGMDLGEIIII